VGEMVEFPSNGGTCPGYLAVPASGSGPGVVVIQEWWGLVQHIRDVCDRYAAEGFTALAPDFYHGESTTEPDEAGKKMMAMRMDQAARDMSGAVRFLLADPRAAGERVGMVGFCMGGGLALYLASLSPEVAACVVYYGVIPWPDAQPRLENIRAAVLGHFAENDDMANRETVGALEQRLRAAGVKVEFNWYPGTTHAFFNDTRPEVYNPEAARQSAERTFAFLRQHLT
jgi:carboxymethylenebutenolidase